MSATLLSEQNLFETKLHCLYLLNQYTLKGKAKRDRKQELNSKHKEEIIDARGILEIHDSLMRFKHEIDSKNEGKMFQQISACLEIPAVKETFEYFSNLETPLVQLPSRYVYSNLGLKLNMCIPLFGYSISNPDSSVPDLINEIRQAASVEVIHDLIETFKCEHPPKREQKKLSTMVRDSLFGGQDSLQKCLDKSLEIYSDYLSKNTPSVK